MLKITLLEQNKHLKLFLVSGVILIAIAIFLSWIAVSGLGEKFLTREQTASETAENIESPVVSRVVDGDTFVLSDGRRVRYIGINAPEKNKCFYREATKENEKLLLGHKIRLEKDSSNRDKYGRLLRDVYVENESGQEIFINDYMVRQGFAKVLSVPPDLKFEQEFNAAKQEAQFQERGFWSACN